MNLFANKKYLLVFAACLVYWSYLFFATQMEIKMDAVAYSQTAEIIYEKGWIAFFQNGPNVEPFFPFIIFIAMKIGQALSVSYTQVEKVFQIITLFVTIFLAAKILQKLKVRDTIACLALLYMGFSPALVNSSLSLFSEINTYPVVLAMILLNLRIRDVLRRESSKDIYLWGVISVLFYVYAICVKVLFSYLMIMFLLVQFVLALIDHKKAKPFLWQKAFIYAVVVFVLCKAAIFPYMWMNKQYGRAFAFTNRVEWFFYANAIKRTETDPIHLENCAKVWDGKVWSRTSLLAHLAYIPGERVCARFFTPQECKCCSFETQDNIGGMELPRRLNVEKIPEDQKKKKTYEWAIESIKKHPERYFVFMLIEASKMFFWETTKLGHVTYPPWLEKLFNFPVFKDGIRFVTAVASIFSFFFVSVYLFRKRRRLFEDQTEEKEAWITGFFVILFISGFTFLYSLVTVLARYTLPIVPLFIIVIALAFDILMKRRALPSK